MCDVGGRTIVLRKETKQKPKNVTKIENEYVRTLEQKASLKKARKVRLHRRLTVFAVIAVVSFALLGKIYLNQNKVLAKKAEEKQMLLADLAETEEEHQLLTRQLEQLNDDEYIAKLARQKYFLSDKNEIIFSIPEKVKKVEKKEQEKE